MPYVVIPYTIVRSLTYNAIGVQGSVALADALVRNTSIQTLAYVPAIALHPSVMLRLFSVCNSIGCNGVGDEGAIALAGALIQNTTLHTL
jgi:hypothetical protein